jgi:hypothetical protein
MVAGLSDHADAVDADAGDHLREAVDAAVGGEVDRQERGEAGHDVAVVGDPPVAVLEDNEHHAALEVARHHEQQEDPVIELVVHVARGEEHGGDVVRHVAARVAGGGRHAVEAHLVNGRHHLCVYGRIRLSSSAATTVELDTRNDAPRQVHAQVSIGEADVRALRRPVAAHVVVAHERTRSSSQRPPPLVAG